MTYVDVREPGTGKLLFRFDPKSDIVEVQRRGVKTVVSLRDMRESGNERPEREAAAERCD